MAFDPTVDYPLGSRRPDLVETPSGLALDEVTLESARAGDARRGRRAGHARDAAPPGRGRPRSGPRASWPTTSSALPSSPACPTTSCSRSTRRSGRAARRAAELEGWAVRLDGLGGAAARRPSSARPRPRTWSGGSSVLRAPPASRRARRRSCAASCSSRRCRSSVSSPRTGRTTRSPSSWSRTASSRAWTAGRRPSST